MSARVQLCPAMTEISRNLSGGGGAGGGRAAPSRTELARVRRDLFGPVDHKAARALADRELNAQSALDSERWGFDFRTEMPKENSRYEWVPVTEHDVVPEPYALRGMPYLRKHAPGTPRKLRADDEPTTAAAAAAAAAATTSSPTTIMTSLTTMIATTTAVTARIVEQMETIDAATPTAERTPPQEPRLLEIDDTTTANRHLDASVKRKRCAIEPTTPVLPPAARKQPVITDFMKSRKRGLNGTTKSMIEPPEKIARNAGQIRS